MSALHIPDFAPNRLISGGGDPSLKVWDWMTGEEKYEIPILQTLEPYIKVRPPRRGRGAWNDNDEEADNKVEDAGRRLGRRARRRLRRQGKGQQSKETPDDDIIEEEQDNGAGPSSTKGKSEVIGDKDAADVAMDEAPFTGPDELTVLAVSKIGSFSYGDNRRIFVIATGCVLADVAQLSSDHPCFIEYPRCSAVGLRKTTPS